MNMPSMPSVSVDNSVSGESANVLSPAEHVEEVVENASEEKEDVKEEKPIYNNPDKDVDNEVDVPITSKKNIEVIATRKGFYKQQRIKEGQTFFVTKFEELGLWMKCRDKSIEKKRLEFFKNKKAKK